MRQTKSIEKNLIAALVRYGQVKTTLARAKVIQGQVDRLITRVKRNTLSGRRAALAILGDKKLANKLADEVALKSQRTSGFTRIIKIGKRKGDGAMEARIEFVDSVAISLPIRKKKKAPPEMRSESKSKKKS